MSEENILTTKQRRFIEEYCVDFNATRAAIRAGYSENTAQEIGSENLSKPMIAGLLLERLDELSMKAEEGIKRLTDMGRGSFEKFLRISETGHFEIDLTTDDAQRNLHLIKKIKQTKRTIGADSGIVEVCTELELHDSKDAIKTLLEIRGKLGGLGDKGELTVNITF